MSLPFFWVLATKSLLPKELQIPNWKTKKETFIIEYKEKYSKYRHEFIKGTILDLYEILHLTEPKPLIDKYINYKISDNGTCYVCYEDNIKIYNFCKNKHHEGICLKCLN